MSFNSNRIFLHLRLTQQHYNNYTLLSVKPTALIFCCVKNGCSIFANRNFVVMNETSLDFVVTVSKDPDKNQKIMEYKVYKKRWFMLFIVCLLNFSSAVLWISFSPVANLTNEFYCVAKDCGAADWLSLVFMIFAIPSGFFAMYSMDTFGLRTGIWIGTGLSIVGASLRVISSISVVSNVIRYPVALTGQSIASVAEPFIMYLPTKLAAQWFPENRRALANTLATMSHPLGIMTTMLATPYIVHDQTRLQQQMLLLNGLAIFPSALTTVLVCLGVWNAVPPTPPSVSAGQVAHSFWPGMKKCLTNKTFMILVLTVGGAMGFFNCMYTLTEQILCAKGYTNAFAGTCGAVLIGGGLVGSILSGMVVDKTKRFEEVAKVCFCLAVVALCAFSVLSLNIGLQIPIAFMFSLFGAFGFSLYPVGLELGVECTFPVAEATSAGLIIVSGQIQGAIFVALMSGLKSKASLADTNIETCTVVGTEQGEVATYSWKVSNLVFCGLASFLALIFILLFFPHYKRMEAEGKVQKRKSECKKESETKECTKNVQTTDVNTNKTTGSFVSVITIL